jgi:hypothetical protein
MTIYAMLYLLQTLDDDAKALKKKFIASMEANVKVHGGKPAAPPSTAINAGNASPAELIVPEAATRIVIKKKGQAGTGSAASGGGTSSSVPPSTATPAPAAAPAKQRDATATPAAQAAGSLSGLISPTAGTTSTSAVSKPRAPKIVVKEKYLWCLEQLRLHYIQGPVVQVRTADPFLKAVDPTKYAGYAEVIYMIQYFIY